MGTPDFEATQRVNLAVHIATRKALDEYKDPPNNVSALAKAIGKRMQGAYGFELRRMADLYPERTGEELYALVIVPHERPWDTDAAVQAAGSREGDRDKARAHRDGPFFDPHDPYLTPKEEVPARIADLRKLLRQPKGAPLAR